jgi:anaerobic magnesium-protoporphyrin IX monomethyl ester cyclase
VKLALVFPPVWDPKQPYLSLPTLAGHLRAHDVDVEMMDLNILSFHWMLENSWLPDGAKPAWASLPADADGPRKGGSFYDLRSLRRSMAGLHERFAAISSLFHPTRVSLYSYHMGVETEGIAAMIRACEDESRNPYLLMWQAKDVVGSLLAEEPVLVGISIPSIHQLVPGVTLARLIKRRAPEVPVFMGGDTVSRFAPRLAKLKPWWDWIDGVVTNEGEEALLALHQALTGGAELDAVPNLLYRKGTEVLWTRTAPPMDPEKFPRPDFDGLPLDLYLSPEPVLPLQTSRGCYWGKCAFCSHTETVKAFRPQSAAAVAETMESLGTRHGARHFVLTDNALPAGTLRRLPEEIRRRGLDVRWSCCARFDLPPEDRPWRQAAEAGMISAWFGLESGSARELALMNKGTTPEQAERVASACLRADIAIDLFVMIGFPGATKEDVVETYTFIHRLLPPGEVPQPLIATGPFALDSCCDVARHPDHYSVLIEPTDEDLPLNLRYRSGAGMQPSDASAVADWLSDRLMRRYPNFPLQLSDREAHSLLLRSRGIGMGWADTEARQT